LLTIFSVFPMLLELPHYHSRGRERKVLLGQLAAVGAEIGGEVDSVEGKRRS